MPVGKGKERGGEGRGGEGGEGREGGEEGEEAGWCYGNQQSNSYVYVCRWVD